MPSSFRPRTEDTEPTRKHRAHLDALIQHFRIDIPPEACEMIAAVLAGLHRTLNDNLLGVYLRGSLATGDFDPNTSDIDAFTVTDRIVSDTEFTGLADLHSQLAKLPNRYAAEVEDTYVPCADARRFVPGRQYPTIARGEALIWTEHSANWVLERWDVRNRGIRLAGPDPKHLIDEITAEDLRSAVCLRLHDWIAWADRPHNPEWLIVRRHQNYVVETMCRALYTLVHGELASKAGAVAWACTTLPEPWRTTVEELSVSRTDDTHDSRHLPDLLHFVRWVGLQGDVERGLR